MEFVWTDYMKYRAALRGFDLTTIEDIVRYSTERYFDTETGGWIVIGSHGTKISDDCLRNRSNFVYPYNRSYNDPSANSFSD